MTSPRTDRSVVVFGAGIAGLTAAHELVDRGFHVTVYDPERDVDSPTPSCAVGGMARSQWGRIELPASPEVPRPVGPGMVGTKPLLEFFPVRIPFAPGDSDLSPDAIKELDEIATKAIATPELHLRVQGHTEEVGTTEALFDDPAIATRLDRCRAAAVADYLQSRGVVAARLRRQAMGYGFPQELNRSKRDRAYVTIASTEALIPGEHGFRFFPSFYRHLFDTMARTPVFEDQSRSTESGRSTLDNIVPTYSTGIYFEDRAPFVMPRRRITSLQSMLDLFVEGMSGIGFTGGDAGRFGVKIFKYATSCTGRRDEYERISWWEFIDGERYSPRFGRYLDASPQFLVAMRGRVSDARSIGNILIQLMKDNVLATARPDGTLSGPTTTAWFDHWRHHLVHLGVRFEVGKLDGFVRGDDGVLPIVEKADGRAIVDAAYVVVAVPPHVIRELLRKHPELQGGDYDRIRALDLGDPTNAVPGGTIAHMSGIQFYFDSDVKFLAGHTHFPDSAWGLTAIFQPQFWARSRGWWSGYRGILSVDIGDFDVPSPVTGKTAWDSTADEIAAEVWRQIKATLADTPGVPEPFLYHLDDNLDGPPGNRRNRSPLMINRAGEFRRRPGEPGNYRLHDRRLVFAGICMQTYTRLTTMEAANESGRHAVNAILRAEGFEGDPCMVVDPESHEFQDLRWLLELDNRLWQLGLPHVLDILGTERAIALLHDPSELQRVVRQVAGTASGRSKGRGIRLSV